MTLLRHRLVSACFLDFLAALTEFLTSRRSCSVKTGAKHFYFDLVAGSKERRRRKWRVCDAFKITLLSAIADAWNPGSTSLPDRFRVRSPAHILPLSVPTNDIFHLSAEVTDLYCTRSRSKCLCERNQRHANRDDKDPRISHISAPQVEPHRIQ